ncbi:putative membrane protein YgcG [Nocardioides thalensis]|uniref:Putative membrane protein YgcG n=1 Tax=Nocardioides thalensis TaxID=1914755 RepID=A0A853C4T9_9ACTN|nr:DUF2207 domain-containing protein [Nocardioides thalensis]NYJ02765.1 putative membrane protein YgcG [Nocardioides thalensis]
MRRIIGSLVAFGVLALILLVPAAFYGLEGDAPDAAEEPTTITSYVADFTVDDDGSMDVVETITVDFPVYDRHGIFRFFDRTDPNDAHLRYFVEDAEVTMDGEEVQFEELVEDGRYDVLKIGDPDSYVAFGEHVYEISYTMPAVLTDGDEDEVSTPSQFYWNLIPGGWQQDIQESRLTVRLPAAAEDVQCLVGWGEESDGATPCRRIQGEGTQTITVTTGPLDDQTPVTLLAGQDVPTPEVDTLPWTPRFDRVFGTSVPVLVIVIGIALLLACAGTWLAWLAHEKEPRFPLMYAPPEGIGPAQANYILTEGVNRQAYVATLLHAAEHGAVDLQRHPDGWTITDKNGAHGWAGLDHVTTGIASLLSGPGTSFVAGRKDVSAGQRLKTEIDGFNSQVKAWASSEGLVVRAGMGGFGGLLVLLGFAAVIAIAIWNPLGITAVGLIPAAFAAAGVPLLKTGAATKRTAAGRELWSRIGGFKRILSTTSAEERFDFAGRKELYTAYIPWAVAFDCADEWAKKYRIETGEEPPAPAYFGAGYVAGGGGFDVDSMVDDFDSTLGSAISSYDATQRSSSSGGGGGFSGGGGGGGGGGGSW